MRKLRLLSVLVVVLFTTSVPVFAAGATVKVINTSKWEIRHMFLSPSAHPQWGPDQLGDETISTGDSFTLTGIECGTYDIKVVDEDGDECVIERVDLCADASVWKITDKNLLECENAE